jgi:hypothetical protein
VKYHGKRGQNQGFSSTVCVDEDPRFAPQLYPLMHGSTFSVRLPWEPLDVSQIFSFIALLSFKNEKDFYNKGEGLREGDLYLGSLFVSPSRVEVYFSSFPEVPSTLVEPLK